ncbi:hypothetical protein [uncultured Planococcus sp.]|uniref:hypothetical protein n=1 Tax=uncultured Planococcus sp. TaxID=337815 RepID=UPI0026040C60|nr:hypothetical protein [uncultured Planococcus sp.]
MNLSKKKVIYSKYLNWTYIDIFLFLLGIVMIGFLPEHDLALQSVGFFIVIISLYLCYKFKDNELLLFLFAIIGFINISIGVSDGILKGIHVAEWQLQLRSTIYNVYTMKSVLLLLLVINIFLSYSWSKSLDNPLEFKKIIKRDNFVISITGTFIMYLILFTGYDFSAYNSNSYISNTNPLIEYAVVIFVFVWFYSGENKVLHYLSILYAILYIFLSLTLGDRSASFLMVLALYLLYIRKKSLRFWKVASLAVLAIVLANFFAEYREGMNLSIISSIENLMNRGLYSDTVSYSYYASITLSATYHVEDTLIYFFEYLKTWFLGSSFDGKGNIVNYVKDNFFYNVGGGIYPAYFYFGLGYFGVLISGIALSLILKYVYLSKNIYFFPIQILIPIMSLRWYLYGPTTLYRSIFIITSLLIIICVVVDKLTKKKVYKKSQTS